MTDPPPHPAPGLVALVDANAPLWAGEAEVFRTYWDWERRTPDTDRRWIARQCHKELVDGFEARLRALGEQWPAMVGPGSRADVLELAESAYEELAHFCAFADAYDAVREGEPALAVEAVRACNWPENVALAELRAAHVRDHGDLGRRAQAFTEGGYCTLYSEGQRLRGRGGVDEAIAAACALVYDDEWDHMLQGIAGAAVHDLSPDDWALLAELSVAQMRARIRMRNAQFGFPVSPARVAAIEAGDVVPLVFDYPRAGLQAP